MDKVKLPLRFTPKTVREFEKVNGPITDNLDISIEKLVKLIQAGNNNCTEDIAENILESFLDGGGDVLSALLEVIGALEKGGFFPRNLNLSQKVKEQIDLEMKNLDVGLGE